MSEKIELTEKQKVIIKSLGHSLYTEEFLAEWLNRNDNVEINVVAALQAMGAKGFFEAVKQLEKVW